MTPKINAKTSENVPDTWLPENKKKQAMLGIAILVLGIGLFLSGMILVCQVPHHLLPNGGVAPLSHHWKIINDLGVGGFCSGVSFATAGGVLYMAALKTPRMDSQKNPFSNRIAINRPS